MNADTGLLYILLTRQKLGTENRNVQFGNQVLVRIQQHTRATKIGELFEALPGVDVEWM